MRPSPRARRSRQYVGPRAHLIRAVVSLATGPEDIRGRLPRVYPVLANIRPDELPAALREDFKWVLKRLTSRQPRHNGPAVWESPAEASVAAMKTATAAKIARVIAGLSERLRTIATND